MKSNKLPKKCNPDTFGRSKTFGYPIDIMALENTTNPKILQSEPYCGFFRLCQAQSNPLQNIIDIEEKDIEDNIKKQIFLWLKDALERLPKNQEVCIYLRFRLDDPKNSKIRTTKEVAEIIGISQPTAYRNIQRGLKNLKQDFKKNLKNKISREKS